MILFIFLNLVSFTLYTFKIFLRQHMQIYFIVFKKPHCILWKIELLLSIFNSLLTAF